RPYYYNTQELVWGVTGLGKWVAALASQATAGGTLTADGATINPRAPRRKTADKAWTLMRASEYKQLTLEVPAQAAGAWLVISSEGGRTGGQYKLGGNGLAITRVYRNLAGDLIDPSKGELKLGELVFVDIEVSNVSGNDIQNIAVVDRLPAGFEIENPRLGRSTRAAWMKDDVVWATEFMNVRDDRLEAFGALPAGTGRRIFYTVRVVTSGKFTTP